jgi:hypothetical protein
MPKKEPKEPEPPKETKELVFAWQKKLVKQSNKDNS